MESEPTKEELMRLGAEWAAAMVANDAEQIGSYMADDWVIVSERGISTKEHFLEFVRSGQLTHSKFENVGDARVRVYGDTAVLSIRVVNTAHFGGQTFEADEWTSDVFVKKDGRWLCVLSHITPVDKDFEKNEGETEMSIPKHYSSVMPYIVLPSDADGFIEFITDVFGAEEKLRVNHEGGELMHAEYSINGGTIMFGQSGGEWKPFPCGMFVVVDDVDGLYAKGLAHGGEGNQEPGDRGYGRAAGFVDKWGNQWWLNDPKSTEGEP